MNFPRFAYNNVKRNARAYFAYFLSSAFMVMIFFSFAVFIFHPQIVSGEIHRMAKAGMQAAEYVIFVFAFFFVLYSISVFLKSRNKEFGLLLMLGAKPSQLNRLVFLENMIIGAGAIVSGIGAGLLLSKLFLLLASQIAGTETLPFYWPLKAMLLTAGAFALLFLAISVLTLLFVRKHRVLELIKGNAKPKSEPKASIWLVLLGIALLAAGYFALRTDEVNPASIFVAAGTGIAGTYFFYSQLSVACMRMLKRSRAFVWKGTNLLWISELTYKIKDNARMLFLVTVVTSVASMSAGFAVALSQQAKESYANDPYGLKVSYYRDAEHREEEERIIADTLRGAGLEYEITEIAKVNAVLENDPDERSLYAVSADNYSQVVSDWQTPAYPNDSKSSALLLMPDGFVWKNAPDNGTRWKFEGVDTPLAIETAAGGPVFSEAQWLPLLVVPDEAYREMEAAEKAFKTIEAYYRIPAWDAASFDPNGQEARIGDELVRLSQGREGGQKPFESLVSSRGASYLSGLQFMSVFSFIGAFVALMFSLSSASFLYFKLHAELSRDADMYRSLSKTGLSIGEMKRSATLQIAILFFVPILVSAIQTFVVLDPILTMISVRGIIKPVLMTSSAFLIAQAVYFLLVRSRYLSRLKRVMV